MQDKINVVKKEIDNIRKELFLTAAGVVSYPIANNKLRVICVFSHGKYERRFPIEAVCFSEGEKTFFQVEQKIDLSAVFYEFIKEDGKKVEVTFEYCDADGTWHSFMEVMELEASLFEKAQTKQSIIFSLYRKLAYVICTMLLPLWMADGFFVVKGFKKSLYIDESMRGKKGMFYHAHGIVKNITGYGYSPREIKTNYFVRKYNKACKKVSNPKGILFLSERILERGGNLEIIRREITSKGLEWSEFIDSRPVHKLPFSKIKKAAKMTAGAKVIILEDFYPQIHALSLREESKLVQLWHACGAFKMFGLSDIGKVKHLKQDTTNHRSYSIAFVSGKQMVPFYSEAFGIAQNHVLPFGVPRTDIFFDESYKEKVQSTLHKKYPQLKDKKVVMFAPTFRGGGNKDAFYPMERFNVNSFMEALPEDTFLIIKNHPFVKEKFTYDEKYAERILDMTGQENINDLLFVTSALITDYSSSIFEAALLKIPMLFYVFDLEEYIRTRDFYFDFASFVPGEKVFTLEELVDATKAVLMENVVDESGLQNFCDYFMDAIDGNSTKKIVNFLSELGKTEK